jgi:hypothetical protein
MWPGGPFTRSKKSRSDLAAATCCGQARAEPVLVAGAGLGVVDDAVADAGRQAAEQVRVGMVEGPIAADLLEVGAEHIADEAAPK